MNTRDIQPIAKQKLKKIFYLNLKLKTSVNFGLTNL